MIDRNSPEYREYVQGYIWDAYKDVNGIRPRWINFDDSSIDALEAMADDLQREILSEIGLEQQAEQMVCFAMHHPNGIVYDAYGGQCGKILSSYQAPKFSEIF